MSSVTVLLERPLPLFENPFSLMEKPREHVFSIFLASNTFGSPLGAIHVPALPSCGARDK
eukprot:scaffold2720_cov314-Pavlova_lutheri.AAC.1